MSTDFRSMHVIERKKELLQSHIEQHLKTEGWSHEMVGWYWMWKYQLTLRGVTQQLTALSIDDAWTTHVAVISMQVVIPKE